MTTPETTTPDTQTEETTRMKTITARLFGGKKKFLALALGLLLIPGSAYAAWTLTATGQGSAKVGSLSIPTVSAGTPDNETVLPGKTVSGSFKIDNGNDVALEVYDVQAGTGSGTSTSTALCDPTNLDIVGTGALATPIRIAPGQSTVKIPGVFKLLDSAPEECQGVTLSRAIRLKFRTVAS